MAHFNFIELSASRRLSNTALHDHETDFTFPGGRRFHFRDPSGNELAAWKVG